MTQTKTRSGLRSTISNAYKLYDGQTLLAQYVSPSGGTLLLASTNTTGADGLVSVFTGPASVFYTFDERGNVAQRTSSAGAVTSSDQYDAYGGQTTTSSGDFVGFGGQRGYFAYSSTGFILCTHCYYDPNTGRWLTRDPISYRGGVNLYGYVGNDPGNRWDPLGLDFTQMGDPNHPIFCGFLGGIAGGTAGFIVFVTVSGVTGGAGAGAGLLLGGVAAGAMDQVPGPR